MNATQNPVDLAALQNGLYQVALSLDAVLVNGIQFGVLADLGSNEFLDKVAAQLQRDLARLEEQATLFPTAGGTDVGATLAELRTTCDEVLECVRELLTFRTSPLERLTHLASQLICLRENGVLLIEKLEECARVPQPFYRSRPTTSTAAVKAFLNDLERVLIQAWKDTSQRGQSECET